VTWYWILVIVLAALAVITGCVLMALSDKGNSEIGPPL